MHIFPLPKEGKCLEQPSSWKAPGSAGALPCAGGKLLYPLVLPGLGVPRPWSTGCLRPWLRPGAEQAASGADSVLKGGN